MSSKHMDIKPEPTDSWELYLLWRANLIANLRRIKATKIEVVFL